MKQKKIIHATLTYKDLFFNYLRYFLDNIDAEMVDKFNYFTNKNVKRLFYKFNDYLLFSGQNTVPVRHSKIVQNEILMKEVQSRDWQYLLESLIQLFEGNKTHLKPLKKSEKNDNETYGT